MMRLDDYGFEQTARAVYIMNDSARDYYDSWEELRDFMVSMAYRYGHNSTSFSTGGFCLTFTKSVSDPNEIYVTASVQAYTACRYAQTVGDRLNTIRSLAA